MVKIHQRLGASQMRCVKVIPHGKLAELAAPFSVRAHDAVQAITAFCHQVRGAEAVLRRGRFKIKTKGGYLAGDALVRPLKSNELHIIPAIEGSAKGRGKAVLGLTLLGLSFVPAVNSGVASAFGQAGQAFGPAAATSFQQFGSQLLGRAGALAVLGGLAEVVSPQVSTQAGTLPSSSASAPLVSGQGAAVPLVYGEARLTHPVIVSSGISVDVLR